MFGTDENYDVIVNPDKGDFEIWRNQMCIRDRVVYVFVCLTIIFAMLRERYKSMSQRVEVLNVKLNEQDACLLYTSRCV